jgi:hypothetical protein
MEPQPIGRRAILKREGEPDISLEVRQTEEGGFSFAVDGKWGVMWPSYTPQQLKTGDTHQMTLGGAWQSLLSKYPSYTVTAPEDAFLPAA